MFDHLIFDFDGTISDTYPIFTAALLRFLAERGDVPPSYDDAYRALKISVGHALNLYSVPEDEHREYMRLFKEIARERQRPFSDAQEMLDAVKAAGKHSYIYTHTGKFVYELLDKWKLIGYFDFVLDGSYNFPRKPAPDALNYLVRKTGLDRSRALMIGDRPIDTQSGANAGIAGCLIDTGGYFTDYKTDYRISSLLGLIDII